ncbi:hypothetical protein BY458DRAFT_535081 [Sporodiniella umbellata]|nr:hypothetical protein BY458DRAFT_535081 [Sporodiniella umbellata]
MKARMVHVGKNGAQMSQAYSIHGEHINAVDRARLNILLLDVAEKMENITLYFGHRLTHAQLEEGQVEFMVNGEKKSYGSDLVVGADGAYSKVRDQMMRYTRMDYEQKYIDTAYSELTIPATAKGEFAMDPNHLHIWPRHTFMLIALPNPDGSFTCTLFMPFAMFASIQTEDELMGFFREHFNDAIPLIGEACLKADFFANPRGSLITLKTSPHHFQDRSVIVGDAAHAMVPFYGQGMNCGFQDVQELHKILDHHQVDAWVKDGHVPGLKEALDAYSATRVKDAHAICDLALYNHYEMRHAVTSYRFLARKKLEGFLHRLFPSLVVPLYSMVSFSTLPYSVAVDRWHAQTRGLNLFLAASAMSSLGLSAWVGWRHRNAIQDLVRAWSS